MRFMLWWMLAVAPSLGLIWIVLKDVYRIWPSWLPVSGIGLVSLGITVSVVENWRQFATPGVLLSATLVADVALWWLGADTASTPADQLPAAKIVLWAALAVTSLVVVLAAAWWDRRAALARVSGLPGPT
jgi:hypothetical protein